MKFKGEPSWRMLMHTDKHGDDMDVSIATSPNRVYITGKACSLSYKQARKFAAAILKELDR